MFGFGKKSSDDERKKAEEKTTKVTSKDSNKEDAELTKAKSKSSFNKVDRDDEEPEVVIYDRSEGPHDIGEMCIRDRIHTAPQITGIVVTPVEKI